jgi:NADPH:quinone reductase-like Zn-dependent oxidoreductase
MTAMAMKAIVRDRYGSPDVLALGEVEKPDLTDDGVLVRVHAASVARGDWYTLTGLYVGRAEMGLRRPKSLLLGGDCAGTV